MTAKVLIGKNIYLHRVFAGIKQETLAKKLCITAGALSNIENGKTDITVCRLLEIANVLNVSFYSLVSHPNKIPFNNNSIVIF